MIIEGQKVLVKWKGATQKHYMQLGYPKLKQGESFEVPVEHLTNGSECIVSAICDYSGCGEEFQRPYKSFKDKRKNGNKHFCSRECANNELKENSPLKGKRKVKVHKLNCEQCGEEIERTDVELKRAKNHFCSKKCADYFMKGKPNGRSQQIPVNCHTCGEKFTLPPYRVEDSERHFCSRDCQNEWQKSDEYSKIHRNENNHIKTNCDCCGKEIEKRIWEYEKNKFNYCSKECLAEHRKLIFVPPNKKEKIKVNCEYCNKVMKVNESKVKNNKWHFCSRDCYANYRSEYITGENVYNYNSTKHNCDNCGKEVEVTPYYLENKKNVFCGQECYWEFRSKYYVGENHPQFGTKKTPEQIERMREITINRIANGDMPQTNTTIHKKVCTILDKSNIKYTNEYPLKYYCVDIYLDDYDLMIEIMGDYWHASPLKYPSFNLLNETQRKDVVKDKSKNTYIKNQREINVLYLWESDINECLEFCELLIINYIDSKGKLDDYQSFNYTLDIKGNLILKENIVKPYFLSREIIKVKH